MTDFDDKHPRQAAGRFTDKPQSAPEASLASPAAKPRKPGQLGAYEIKGFRNLPIGREGGAFTASIYRDGKRVLTVENNGDGGSNVYTDLGSGMRHFGAEIDMFKDFAAKATPEQEYEPEDSLVETMKWLGDIEKAAAKNRWPRADVIEENIRAHDETAYHKLTEREKAILRDPTILDSE